MASIARRALRPLRKARPVFVQEVQAVVAPEYARRDELQAAVADIRRIIGDHLDAGSEEAAVLGRLLSGISAEVESLRASVDALAAAVADRDRHRDG